MEDSSCTDSRASRLGPPTVCHRLHRCLPLSSSTLNPTRLHSFCANKPRSPYLHLAASNVLPPGLSWGRFMESKRQLRCHHLHEVPSDFLKRSRCPSSLCLLSEFLLEYFSYCATASLCVSAHSTQQTTDPLCPRSTSCEDNGYGFRSVRLRLESDSHLCIILCPISAPSLDVVLSQQRAVAVGAVVRWAQAESRLTDMNWMSARRHSFLLVPNTSV